MVTVIDSGIVNIRNIARALEHVGATVCVSRDVSDVERAKRIVLPGVGAFAPGMKELRDRRLDQAIVSVAHLGIPVLGICLGMQMLFEKSYEKGCHSGLGIIPGTVIPIPRSGPSAETPRKVPHVGWPHIDPVTIAMQVNVKPIGAILFVISTKFLILKMKFRIDSKAIQVNEARPIHAAGT